MSELVNKTKVFRLVTFILHKMEVNRNWNQIPSTLCAKQHYLNRQKKKDAGVMGFVAFVNVHNCIRLIAIVF